MVVYCIPGLGADERLFGNLSLKNGVVKPLSWLRPDNSESLKAYAGRMATQIDGTRPYCLLGVSFGGMIAGEMARLASPTCTIIVSSVRQSKELPWYGRLAGQLHLHRLIPMSVRPALLPLGYKLIGVLSDADRSLVRLLVVDTDQVLFRWSVDQALRWEFTGLIPGLIHVHGTADRILPARYVNPDHWISDGTHLMIYNRAAEISALIDAQLARFQD